MVFWDYVTRLEEETRRLVRCYCSKEMNEEFPACTDKDCNDLNRLNQENVAAAMAVVEETGLSVFW